METCKLRDIESSVDELRWSELEIGVNIEITA
jgi:hypothetical protein